MAETYHVYVYFRLDGTPCYVGMGRGQRWRHHLTHKTNPHLYNIIQAAKAGGMKPLVVVVRAGITTRAEACMIEQVLIAAIGREKNGGPLVNQTDGGDGGVGYNAPKSASHRAKIGAAHKGRKISAETAAKLSAINRGRPRTPDQIERSRLGNLGAKRSPEGRANLLRGQRNMSPQTKAVKRIKCILAWAKFKHRHLIEQVNG